MKSSTKKSLKTGVQQLPFAPSSIEPKWQEKWEKEKLYQPDLQGANKPFYNLMMFPYPSAEGLHVGNMYAFTGADIYGRFKRMQGNDVFEPIGLDGFGIHSENYALKVGSHPMDQSKKSETHFYRQLHSIGNGFDWSRTVETYKPDYYRWTQWLFVQLFKAGLAYKKTAPVNFCPSCKTVLADEQVIDGKCERCGSEVEKRDLAQWFFRITKYSQRLLTNLNNINWSEKVKVAQRNWIGKSEGAQIPFELTDIPGQEDGAHKVSVFTTRPDTLYGATFLAISPELAKRWLEVGWKAGRDVEIYVKEALLRRKQEDEQEKTGVFAGIYAIHPLRREKIPVWIADYVLSGYGTGAIMAVPAHDERDFAFAKQHGLPIEEVISGGDVSKEAYTGDGVVINSGDWNGLRIPEEMDKVIAWLEKKGIGKKEAHFHLRDWLISRQRYWGPPIPMIFCEQCATAKQSWFKKEKKEGLASDWDHSGWYPVGDNALPVQLPYVEDFKPLGTGVSPLASVKAFYETTCPGCGQKAKRETDVSDTFLDSAWYFLRYIATEWEDMPFPSQKLAASEQRKKQSSERRRWLPVTMYIGGAEHSVLHLLYARFITMVLFDLKMLDFEEPFERFYAHGLLIKDGGKMSKSKGNIIVPDAYIKKFGADTFRSYLMFLGPFSDGGDFRESGIEGMFRFMKRVWVLLTGKKITGSPMSDTANRRLHQLIAAVTADMEQLRYNTALAKLMAYYNDLSSQEEVHQKSAEVFIKLLAPFAPHMTEELWSHFGHGGSVHREAYPRFDEGVVAQKTVKILIQQDDRVRDVIEVGTDEIQNRALIEKRARESKKLQRNMQGKKEKRILYIPGKVINFITK